MKDKNVAAILALFAGTFGVHKFYLGRIGSGLLYFLFSFTFIPALLGLIDFFVLALMDTEEFNRRYNGSNMLPGPVVVNMLPPAAGYGPPSGYGPHGWSPYVPRPGMGHGYPGGSAQHGASAAPQAKRDVDDLARQLEKLNELRIAGLLTEEEFSQQKTKLLDAL